MADWWMLNPEDLHDKSKEDIVDPTDSDDASKGFKVSSHWVNITNDNAFICVDATLGAAVWRQVDPVTGLLNNLDATTDPDANEDSGDGYSIGSRWINVTLDKEFVCLDSTLTAAVWTETTSLGASEWTESGGDIARATGNVAIGLAAGAGDGKFHVYTGTAGVVAANSSADEGVFESSGDSGINILNPDANIGSLMFGSGVANLRARLQWDKTNDVFTLGTANGGASLSLLTGNSVEAMNINASQNFALGIAVGDGKFHIHDSSAGVVTANSAADILTLERVGNGGISIITDNGGTSAVYLGSPANNAGSFLVWQQSAALMRMGTNETGGELSLLSGVNAEVIRADVNQDVGIGIFASIAGKLHVDQASPTGAKPTLHLDQADVSEEFIKFTAIEATGNTVEDVAAKSLTVTKFLRVNINGTDLYLQAGTIA